MKLLMQKQIKAIMCLLTGFTISISSVNGFALTGNEAGYGGSGGGFQFTELGVRIFNYLESLKPTSPYLALVNLPTFRKALRKTLVEYGNSAVYDRYGIQQTATYITADEFRERLIKDGMSAEHAAELVKDDCTGLITVDAQRFQSELVLKVPAYMTVLHEYLRAMDLPEEQYFSATTSFDTRFILDVIARADYPMFAPEIDSSFNSEQSLFPWVRKRSAEGSWSQ